MIALLLFLAAIDPRVVEAQRLAAHGEHDAARGVYATILQDLERSGADASALLHYNLGTLALHQGDLGPAMLHLLAAQRRDPGNDDIAWNLARAREARIDRVEASSPSSSLSSLGASLSPSVVRVALAVASVVCGLVLLLRGALGPRVPVSVVAAVGVLWGLAFFSWGARRIAEGRVWVVVLRDTTARSSPDEKAGGFDVHAGLAGERVEENNGWQRVRLENGLDVWLSADAVRVVP